MSREQIRGDFDNTVKRNVSQTLHEDIGTGDITAELIPATHCAKAEVITREQAVICGRPWVDEVFYQVDHSIQVEWHVKEGEYVTPGQSLFSVEGNTRSILSAERNALNFLQFLSGIATRCHHYTTIVKGTGVKLLDTRKTIPGLRMAQKYAVRQGGCFNHRSGLYDAFLIKENHILACGGIEKAIATARNQHPDKTVEIEVESLEELSRALHAEADIIMLDNFSLQNMRESVQITSGRARLEASGNINEQTIKAVAETGVDFISLGTLTKDCKAIDLSMRIRQ